MRRLARCLALPAVVVGAAALAVSAPDRVARLLDAGPSLTVESALADVVVLAGTAAAVYLALTSAVVVVIGVVAPRSRALRVALRMTPRRWRRIALAAAGVAVVMAGASPAAAAPSGGDDRRPDLNGLRLPDRPESPAPARAAVPASTTTTWVVVTEGDCLWDLAHQRLPSSADDADVARSVARWHHANRARIGPDPDLLLPGTRLRQPRPDPSVPTSEAQP